MERGFAWPQGAGMGQENFPRHAGRGGAGMGQDKILHGGSKDPILRTRPAPLPTLDFCTIKYKYFQGMLGVICTII